MEAHARAYVRGSEFVANLAELTTIDAIAASLPTSSAKTVGEALRVIEEVLGRPVEAVVASDELKMDAARLGASFIASLILGRPHEELSRGLRIIRLLGQPRDGAGLDASLEAPMLLPETIFPLPLPAANREPTTGAKSPPPPDRTELAQEALDALAMLMALPPEAHELPPQPAPEPQPTWQERVLGAVRDRLSVPTRQRPPPDLAQPVRFASTVRSRLPRRLADELRARGAPLETGDVQTITRVRRQIAASAPPPPTSSQKMIRSGGRMVSIRQLQGQGAASAGVTTSAAVRVVGFADLMRVESQIRRYEEGEIAHIENVLEGELRRREHRHLESTQELVVVETERTEASERDLESTEKFELERESTEVQKSDSKFEAGLTVSASYGPTISTESNLSYASQQSAERTSRAASRYARSVTERSSTRIRERALNRREVRTVTETEEKNLHELNNPAGAGHIVGVYRWVDKIYELRTINYGKRLMVDFVVPEPAAFLLHALAESASDSISIEKPVLFDRSADQIDVSNYRRLAATYNATTIHEPPPEYVTIAHLFKFDAAPARSGLTSGAQVAKVDIPVGYRAITAFSRANVGLPVRGQDFFVIVGRHLFSFSTLLDGEVGSIPVHATAVNLVAGSVGVEILCQRTDDLYARWQIETHAFITEAYLSTSTRSAPSRSNPTLGYRSRIWSVRA